MLFTPPKFWETQGSYIPYLLEPLSWLYRLATLVYKVLSKPYCASIPIISIGNFVLGGAGKTPVTIAFVQKLKAMGYTPHIISRGYGGSLSGPICVDPTYHQFTHVGDEPLLLAKHATTWVSRNRAAAVNLAIQKGADVIVLDDAHQNYTLKKDLSFVVVNSTQAFGNGHVFPAGPLRQTVKSGIKDTSAVIFIKHDQELLPEPLSSLGCPVIDAKIVPLNPKPSSVIGFAGIGYPDKFRKTLISAGYDVKGFFPFPDHYAFSKEDIDTLRAKAHLEGAMLITTEKDFLRLPKACNNDILTLPIYLEFQSTQELEALLKKHLHRSR